MRYFVVVIALFCIARVQAEDPKPLLALGGLDPVELINGKEVAGKDDITDTHYRYLYQFANAKNKKEFEKTPERYKIQLGGACARMGPLSGSGNPGRFVVHDKRIYIFASEQCKAAFLKAPANFLPQNEPMPIAQKEPARRAGELLDKAVEAVGGKEKLDGLKTFQIAIKIAYKQGDAITEGTRTRTIDFAGRYRQEEEWGTSRYGDAVSPTGGFQFVTKESWEMEPEIRDLFRQSFARDPLVLLKARGEKGFVAIASGKEKLGDIEAELVLVHWQGVNSVLAIDPAAGRILQSRHPTRSATGPAQLTRAYNEFKKVDGLMLPHGWLDSIDGKVITNPTVRVDSIRVNPKLNDKLFAR